jgi:predicted nucleic acid-binding protein
VIIVSDTSPINNLAAINQLVLLQQLYETVIIPEAVYRELTIAEPKQVSGLMNHYTTVYLNLLMSSCQCRTYRYLMDENVGLTYAVQLRWWNPNLK